nr:retrovirus-related Pol polyprotein from transposon TNT 1-94 [Tanacetum cinerariifolium]
EYDVALETLLADMKAGQKDALMKKAYDWKIGLYGKVYLKMKLYTYYMSPGTKLADHSNKFNKLILDLANIDIEIDDEYQPLMLLTSLPSSYDNFVETLLFGREFLTMEDVLTTLNSRELKKRIKGTTEETSDGLYVRGMSVHLGGSYHMTPRKDFLYDFKGFDGGSVQLGDHKTCTIRETWIVKIQLHDGSSFILEDV